MTREEDDDRSEETLRRELATSRETIQELEAELAETNEGMIALTLELEGARERYQKIFEASNDAILLIDADENSIYEANPRACELFGYSHDALVSLSASEIFPDESGQYDSFIDAVFRGWVDDFTCRTKDGKRLEMEVSASVFKLDNRSILLAAMRDITRRKRREQQLQVLNRLFRHNLRNDGNVIEGHADILHAELSETDLQKSAAAIKRAISEILGLSRKVRRIQDVLDQTHISPVPLSDLLETQRTRIKKRYPEARITTEPPPTEVLVGQRLSPALHEAILNGIKHSDEEAPTVSVTSELSEDEDQLLITVLDRGPGLPEHERAVIQAGEESPLEHGSGVGLWFIQWVVSSLGGELTIRENHSPGTELRMDIPIREYNEPSDGERRESASFEVSNDY